MYRTAKRLVARVIPTSVLWHYEPFIRPLVALPYRGSAITCPLCQRSFRKLVDLPTGDRLCPHCGALDRTRLLWLYLNREHHISQKYWRVLDFSPHRTLARQLKGLPQLSYQSSDYETDRCDHRYDIMQIPEPDGQFDLVICYHVLEHVPDDHRAMNELWRITKPGGLALLQVPHREAPTHEDPNITSPEERKIHFGQEDHWRYYGREDFAARLAKAGFQVEQLRYANTLSEDEVTRFALRRDELIFVARRPQAT